jgi:protein-S-isoprenylcysteine O-methyltransferase Ste14
MGRETLFRTLMFVAFIALGAMRFYYQSRILREQRKVDVREGGLSILAGLIAALTAIVFGAEYIFYRGAFAFAYALRYPDWVRWLGALLLFGGLALQGAALHYLGQSFHSLVVTKENQVLVESGPYHWMRHPIYAAYLMSYLGGGLLASNWVLTFVPVAAYAVLAAIRMPQEEKVMEELFGQAYTEYKSRTGRLLPWC